MTEEERRQGRRRVEDRRSRRVEVKKEVSHQVKSPGLYLPHTFHTQGRINVLQIESTFI